MRLEAIYKNTHLWTRAEGLYGISTTNPRYIKFLQALTNHYPPDTHFFIGDEPIFYFTASQIETVATRSRKLTKLFNLAGWSRSEAGAL